MLFLGFSAGIPLLLIFSSLSLWLREAGVARSTVTFFSWAALAYSFKFVWAPLVDRLPLPFLTPMLGRRRGWLVLAQLAVIGALLFMAGHDPQESLVAIAVGAVMLGFAAATQDIVIDAYRIERADAKWQALMSSTYIAGYRIGMLAAGAGALALASLWGSGEQGYSYSAWSRTYQCMALAMTVGLLTTLCIAEPKRPAGQAEQPYETADYLRFLLLFVVVAILFVLTFINSQSLINAAAQSLASVGLGNRFAGFAGELLRLGLSVTVALLVALMMVRSRLVPSGMLKETYVSPFRDFFDRYGRTALLILLLIATYRISDIVMGTVANVFYDDRGYSKEQIAAVSKTFGLVMTLVGGFFGGIVTIRYGVFRSLWWGALLVCSTNLLFALLAVVPPDIWLLATVIAVDNLSGGMASATFVAYLSSLTNRSFTAMQYAVFSSLMTLFPKLWAGYSGTIVDSVGYTTFFIFSALIGVPVLFLVSRVARRMG